VNPEAKVQTIPSRWQDDYLALREADVIFGCVDSFGERLQLESAARRFLTPYIDIGMDVSSEDSGFRITGQVALSIPGKKCLRCMGLFNDDDLAKEAYGVAGGRPQVIWPNGLLASAAVGCFVKLVCPWNRNLETPLLLGFEGNTQLLQRDNRLLHNPNGVCVHFPDEQIGDPLWVPEGL
jgi:hypothetical protein